MEDKQFSQEIAKKFSNFFAHMDQFCQQFLQGQQINELYNDKNEKKKERDPNAPKRPLTAFFLFSQKYREKVLERNPEVKTTQISQMAGLKWNSMSEEEKQPYIDLYSEAKNKYENELKDYNDKNGIQTITNEKKKKKSNKQDDKSIKSGLDNPFDDIYSESIQPCAKHQQQLKKQIDNINSDEDDDEDDQIQQLKQTKQQSQKNKAVKSKKKQDVDDDLQREINQVINNDKSLKKSTKK